MMFYLGIDLHRKQMSVSLRSESKLRWLARSRTAQGAAPIPVPPLGALGGQPSFILDLSGVRRRAHSSLRFTSAAISTSMDFTPTLVR
jgi:hypothetical protein